ncbi:MAG: radical SAM protein [Candidatus Aminicenantes bacterium]|nr:radical SAM protein [Candidatus Aminicenantes bacterium]
MRVEAFRGGRGRRPRMLKYPLSDTPHFTIETNKTCNLRCRSCYSLDREGVKSRAEIAAEVDLGLSKRNAGIVTLLGGEPTLHPELPGIIADIKAKGLRCQLLTNGVKLMTAEGDELLDALAAAGLDRVFVHIDEGQAHIHGDIEAARRAVFDKLEARRMRFGLSLTVYEDTSGRIPDVLRAYAGYRYFDSVLAVLARDAGTTFSCWPASCIGCSRDTGSMSRSSASPASGSSPSRRPPRWVWMPPITGFATAVRMRRSGTAASPRSVWPIGLTRSAPAMERRERKIESAGRPPMAISAKPSFPEPGPPASGRMGPFPRRGGP